MTRPLPSEYDSSFQIYFDLLKGDDIFKILKDQILNLQSLLSDIPEDKEDFVYAENKWTIKEVIGHITDTERIISYRALCIARGETKNLPQFDEKLFVLNANFNARSIYDLSHEFSQVREGTVSLFKSFSEDSLNRIGTANSKSCSVRALMFLCAGHAAHHFKIIRTRYF